jgi:hypothetical protein
MIKDEIHFLAPMASHALQGRFITNGDDRYLLPEEMIDGFIDALRRLILHSNDPLKERVLNLYVYSEVEMSKVSGALWGTPHWENIRTATKNFLITLVGFDLSAWERQALSE